jgi:hypothetical protein
MRGSLRNVSVMPAKAGIQTWPHVRGPWIPAYAGMTLVGRVGRACSPQRQAVRQERSNLIHTSSAAALCLAESVARIAASSIANSLRKLQPSILKTGPFGLIDCAGRCRTAGSGRAIAAANNRCATEGSVAPRIPAPQTKALRLIVKRRSLRFWASVGLRRNQQS